MTEVSLYHLRNIVRVRPFLSCAETEKLSHAFISSRPDYCNALLSGVSEKAIGKPDNPHYSSFKTMTLVTCLLQNQFEFILLDLNH